MRKKFIAGNWKMHLNRADSVALAQAVASKAISYKQVDVALCPTFTNLDVVRGALAGTSIGLGAQNMNANPQGAFTGEISAAMLLDVGCKYVILGTANAARSLVRRTKSSTKRSTPR